MPRRALNVGDELVLGRDVPTLAGLHPSGARVRVIDVWGESERRANVELIATGRRICALRVCELRWADAERRTVEAPAAPDAAKVPGLQGDRPG